MREGPKLTRPSACPSPFPSPSRLALPLVLRRVQWASSAATFVTLYFALPPGCQLDALTLSAPCPLCLPAPCLARCASINISARRVYLGLPLRQGAPWADVDELAARFAKVGREAGRLAGHARWEGRQARGTGKLAPAPTAPSELPLGSSTCGAVCETLSLNIYSRTASPWAPGAPFRLTIFDSPLLRCSLFRPTHVLLFCSMLCSSCWAAHWSQWRSLPAASLSSSLSMVGARPVSGG